MIVARRFGLLQAVVLPIVGLMLAFGGQSPAANAQQSAEPPLSERLAQCHVVTDIVVQAATPAQRQADAVQVFVRASELFHQKALEQAVGEGRQDPATYVARIEAQNRAYWAPRANNPESAGEYGQWIEFCTTLGDRLGLQF